jgi:hypothetical protein
MRSPNFQPATLIVGALLCVLLVVWGASAMAYEEPPFTVVTTNTDYEIREYSDRLAVRMVSNESSNTFRALFRYISGDNETATKVDMTVPVTQSTKIEMTVPVTQTSEDGSGVMEFYLPARFDLTNAPKPTDPRIQLVVIPGGRYGVIKYSGRPTDQNFLRQSSQLQDYLKRDGIAFEGLPIKATYNGPFTLFFIRRNEAMFRLSN